MVVGRGKRGENNRFFFGGFVLFVDILLYK